MANYNAMNPVSGSATLKLKFENYIAESLKPIEGISTYEQFFYMEDIPQVDPRTGKKWSKTFRVSKPQGPGGYFKYSEEQFAGAKQFGYMGLQMPNEQEYILSTRFNGASIGRTFQDKINDTDNFYDAVKASEFGAHIREQQLEEIKSEIFKNGVKTYANGKTTEDDIVATDVLTWNDITTLVEAIETYEVQVIDNRKRVADDFVKAVKAVGSITVGSEALDDLNVIDFKAFQEAQKAFEEAGLRTYRWTAPRFNISGVSSANYESTNIDAEAIKFTAPAMKDLFTKHHKNQDAPMAVLVSKEGYNQLWADADFKELVEVSGYRYDAGLSGRFDKYIRKNKSVNVQGILIINMEQDYIHGAEASEGIDFGLSVNAGNVRLDAALIPTPGYNFITSSSAFGTRTTIKTTDENDMIDRMGYHEYMYTLFTFDVQINTPSAFNLLIHASK